MSVQSLPSMCSPAQPSSGTTSHRVWANLGNLGVERSSQWVNRAQPASVLREIRTRLGLSQAKCATALGVAVEAFRTWDAGRRLPPAAVVRRAQTLTVKRARHDRVPIQVLADEPQVDVRTLRAAARDGRLAATFHPRGGRTVYGDVVSTDLRTRPEHSTQTSDRRFAQRVVQN